MKHRSNPIPNLGKQQSERDRQTPPPGYKYQFDSHFHAPLTFKQRLQLIFGYRLYVNVRSYFAHNPGAWRPTIAKLETSRYLEPPINPHRPAAQPPL